MNLEESDALAGIAFIQMPMTRLRIIRLDTGAFASGPSGRDDPVGGLNGFGPAVPKCRIAVPGWIADAFPGGGADRALDRKAQHVAHGSEEGPGRVPPPRALGCSSRYR